MCKKAMNLHGKKTTKKAPAKKQAKTKKTPAKAKAAPEYTQAELWFFRNEDVLN